MGRALKAVVGWAFVAMLIVAGCGEDEPNNEDGQEVGQGKEALEDGHGAGQAGRAPDRSRLRRA